MAESRPQPKRGDRTGYGSAADCTLRPSFGSGIGCPASRILPAHRHPHEQTGYLVSGRLELTIGDECHLVTPGDSWCIAGNVTHSAVALDDAVAVEAFSPVREDYLP